MFKWPGLKALWKDCLLAGPAPCEVHRANHLSYHQQSAKVLARRKRQNKTTEAEGSSLSSSLQNADYVKYGRTRSVPGVDSPHTPVPNGSTTHSEGCTDNRVHFAPSFHGYEPNACSNIFKNQCHGLEGVMDIKAVQTGFQMQRGILRGRTPTLASFRQL